MALVHVPGISAVLGMVYIHGIGFSVVCVCEEQRFCLLSLWFIVLLSRSFFVSVCDSPLSV